jgi:hypothetical protein
LMKSLLLILLKDHLQLQDLQDLSMAFLIIWISFPGLNSVIIMNNCWIHKSNVIIDMVNTLNITLDKFWINSIEANNVNFCRHTHQIITQLSTLFLL